MEWDEDASEPEGTTEAKGKRSNMILVPQDEAHLHSHHKKYLLAEESMTQERQESVIQDWNGSSNFHMRII